MVTTRDTQPDTRAKGGNGNGRGENNPPPLYEIVYDGSIFKSNVAYYRFHISNGKHKIMSSDCGDLMITEGFEAVDCYTGKGSLCGDIRETISLKSKSPKVATQFVFVDPINCSNVRSCR